MFYFLESGRFSVLTLGFANLSPGAQSMMGPRAARYRAASIARAAMLYRRAHKRGEISAEGTKETPALYGHI